MIMVIKVDTLAAQVAAGGSVIVVAAPLGAQQIMLPQLLEQAEQRLPQVQVAWEEIEIQVTVQGMAVTEADTGLLAPRHTPSVLAGLPAKQAVQPVLALAAIQT